MLKKKALPDVMRIILEEARKTSASYQPLCSWFPAPFLAAFVLCS
jgi:hypothetical protein